MPDAIRQHRFLGTKTSENGLGNLLKPDRDVVQQRLVDLAVSYPGKGMKQRSEPPAAPGRRLAWIQRDEPVRPDPEPTSHDPKFMDGLR